jgi:hypothetical protein
MRNTGSFRRRRPVRVAAAFSLPWANARAARTFAELPLPSRAFERPSLSLPGLKTL